MANDDTTNEIAFVQAVQEQSGGVATRGDGTSAAIPMAIFSSVDYNGVNSAPTFLFKQISGEKPTVTSGIRVGTPAVTSRGLVTEDMDKIAEFMYLAATQFDTKADEIRAGVNALCAKYPLYE